MTKSQQMLLVDVQLHDLLEQLIQRLVRVRDDQRSLLRKVVVDVGDDLHGHVGLTGTRRTDDQRETVLHAAVDRLDLCRCERNRVLLHLLEELVLLHAACDLDLGLAHIAELQRVRRAAVLGDLQLAVRKRASQVLQVQKSVVEVESVDGVHELAVVRRRSVAVAEQQVVYPVGHDEFGVDQVLDRF